MQRLWKLSLFSLEKRLWGIWLFPLPKEQVELNSSKQSIVNRLETRAGSGKKKDSLGKKKNTNIFITRMVEC